MCGELVCIYSIFYIRYSFQPRLLGSSSRARIAILFNILTPNTMAHPKEEQVLIIVKPDAIQRGLLGEITARFERKGLKIVGMKMINLEDALLEAHYAHIADKPFFAGIKAFMKASPVVVMVLSGINAVSATRILVGPTKGFDADAGSIRGDLSLSIQSNVVHSSDSTENGKAEVARFFKDEEIFDYKKSNFDYVYADEAF